MMTGRFRPDELFGSDGAFRMAEGAGVLAVARELEAAATVAVDIRPSAGFADLVLAAIVGEPSPRPIAAIGRAARGGGAHALVAAVGDAWRTAWGGGRPFAVRAQAFGVVLALLVMMVSVGGLTAAGVARLLGPGPQVLAPVGPTSTPSDRPRATEEQRSTVEATPSATPSPSPQPTEATEPTPTDRPAATPGHTSRPTAHPTETPEGTDDHDGDSGSGSDSSGGGGGATATPHPTDGD